MESNDLKKIFDSFNGAQKTMEGKSFAKMAKDCHLIDKKFTATDVDLIFAKVKDKAERRITYDQFLKALDLVADKKGVPHEQLHENILKTGGPQFKGTEAEKVKFHDDKSLYTGVHANGGPTNVDSINPSVSFG